MHFYVTGYKFGMMVLVSLSFSRCVNFVGRGQVLVLNLLVLVLVLNLLVLVLVLNLLVLVLVLVLVLKGLVLITTLLGVVVLLWQDTPVANALGCVVPGCIFDSWINSWIYDVMTKRPVTAAAFDILNVEVTTRHFVEVILYLSLAADNCWKG